MAYEVQNFQEDVLDASHDLPVVVDFWAPWCGPCRTLGPILEDLAAANGSQWKLAKLNTDENQELSIQYGIRGIPAVKMFVDGKVVDEFTGALPRYAVEQWLARALPSKSRPHVAAAEQAINAGNHDKAREHLKKAIKEEPGNARATLLLAQLDLFEDPEGSLELIRSVEIVDPVLTQIADGLGVVAGLLSMRPPYENLLEGAGHDGYVKAIDALRKRDFRSAIEAFISVVQQDRYYDDDGARKACLAIFSILGDGHPVVKEYRPRFNMALY